LKRPLLGEESSKAFNPVSRKAREERRGIFDGSFFLSSPAIISILIFPGFAAEELGSARFLSYPLILFPHNDYYPP